MRRFRKKKKSIQEAANHEFLMITPDALAALEAIIRDESIQPSARVQAIAVILDRSLGKPEENIRIRSAESSIEEAQARLDEIFKKMKQE